ncbi:PQQ-binding-like beta-propeller repeat protein [Streptomyces sp. NPDC048639]|uniref:outer membrane protein assembly factor BamB family protein n=1 Tax=Streptomyces sp. NPDC048639 TaxID=3365581 RepID=UPI00371306B2
MSQPPQPPNQPPQGEFGAPQDPAYGYPQQPPQPPQGQPSYGYPQNPPPPGQAPQAPPPPGQPPQTPPAAAGQPPQAAPAPGQPPQAPASPYGYPGAQQPGQQPQFGQPPYGQQAYGQQAYGPGPYAPPQYGMYPPQAPYPGATPPGGGSKQRVVLIVGAAVAALLLIVGGVWFATSGDGDGKKDEAKNSSGGSGTSGGSTGGDSGGSDGGTTTTTVEAELITKIPRPKVDEQVTAEGLWVTDTVFAKSGVDEIVGYDVSGGEKKWEIPLDGSVCWASRHTTEDGSTAVLFQGAKTTKDKLHQGCTEVAAINVNTGKKLWQKSISESGRKLRFDEVTIGGGTVAAGGISGGAAWKLDGGERLWKPGTDKECRDDGYAGGEKLVAVKRCGEYSKPELEVQTLNPSSGSPKSVYKVPSGIEYVHIASTDPLVIAVDASDDTGSGVSDFFAIDDGEKTGKLRGKIATQQGQYTPECGSTDVEDCKLVTVTQDTLYMPTKEHQAQADYGRTNEIVAFDLDGGKTKGKADAGEGRVMVPLRMEGGDIIAYKYPTYDKGGEVVSIDGKTLKQSVLLKNDDSTARTESVFRPEFNMDVVYKDSRLYMGQHYITNRKPLVGEKEYLAIVFGED